MALIIETEKYRFKEYPSLEIIVLKEKAKDEFEDDAYVYRFVGDEYWRIISKDDLEDLYEKIYPDSSPVAQSDTTVHSERAKATEESIIKG